MPKDLPSHIDWQGCPSKEELLELVKKYISEKDIIIMEEMPFQKEEQAREKRAEELYFKLLSERENNL